jgi:hypothetical protein
MPWQTWNTTNKWTMQMQIKSISDDFIATLNTVEM